MGREVPGRNTRLCDRGNGNFPISLLDGVIEGWEMDAFYLQFFLSPSRAPIVKSDSGTCEVAFVEATESKPCLLDLVGFETK